jgi:hypothetical protein
MTIKVVGLILKESNFFLHYRRRVCETRATHRLLHTVKDLYCEVLQRIEPLSCTSVATMSPSL